MPRGDADLELLEVYEIADLITQYTHSDTDLVFGALIDPSLAKRCRVTVIAAGVDAPTPQPKHEHQPPNPIPSRQHTPTPARNGQPQHQGNLDVPDFLR
jgi:cell division protein FtsZ